MTSPKIRLYPSKFFDCVLDRGNLSGLVLLLSAAEYDVKNYLDRGRG